MKRLTIVVAEVRSQLPTTSGRRGLHSIGGSWPEFELILCAPILYTPLERNAGPQPLMTDVEHFNTQEALWISRQFRNWVSWATVDEQQILDSRRRHLQFAFWVCLRDHVFRLFADQTPSEHKNSWTVSERARDDCSFIGVFCSTLGIQRSTWVTWTNMKFWSVLNYPIPNYLYVCFCDPFNYGMLVP